MPSTPDTSVHDSNHSRAFAGSVVSAALDVRQVQQLAAVDLQDVEHRSTRVPEILNAGTPEPACRLMAAAVPRAGSGLADGTW